MNCHHYMKMKQDYSSFLSLLAIRKKILTEEGFARSLCPTTREGILLLPPREMLWILNLMYFGFHTWSASYQWGRNPEMGLVVLWSSSTALPQIYKKMSPQLQPKCPDKKLKAPLDIECSNILSFNILHRATNDS